jgi:hypothetical protein
MFSSPTSRSRPFIANRNGIDLASCQVVAARQIDPQETLVVAQIQVDLTAVVGDPDFPVLGGPQGACIVVDVGVDLDGRCLVAILLQDLPDRGRRKPLADPADHASRNDDVLGTLVFLCHRTSPSRLSVR